MTFYLFRSDKKDKKYVMVMPDFKHVHYFGATGYRDFTLMSSRSSKFYEPDAEKRERIRKRYIARHAHEPKGIHTPSTLADTILWSKPTVLAGVRKYAKKYGVKVVSSSSKLTKKRKEELMM